MRNFFRLLMQLQVVLEQRVLCLGWSWIPWGKTKNQNNNITFCLLTARDWESRPTRQAHTVHPKQTPASAGKLFLPSLLQRQTFHLFPSGSGSHNIMYRNWQWCSLMLQEEEKQTKALATYSHYRTATVPWTGRQLAREKRGGQHILSATGHIPALKVPPSHIPVTAGKEVMERFQEPESRCIFSRANMKHEHFFMAFIKLLHKTSQWVPFSNSDGLEGKQLHWTPLMDMRSG